MADAVQAAVDETDEEDTLIVVTGDHSHVFNIAGYPDIDNPILGRDNNPSSEGSAVLFGAETTARKEADDPRNASNTFCRLLL